MSYLADRQTDRQIKHKNNIVGGCNNSAVTDTKDKFIANMLDMTLKTPQKDTSYNQPTYFIKSNMPEIKSTTTAVIFCFSSLDWWQLKI